MMCNRNPELEKSREDASQWLQLQYHWMDHVGKDTNYFDDCLYLKYFYYFYLNVLFIPFQLTVCTNHCIPFIQCSVSM